MRSASCIIGGSSSIIYRQERCENKQNGMNDMTKSDRCRCLFLCHYLSFTQTKSNSSLLPFETLPTYRPYTVCKVASAFSLQQHPAPRQESNKMRLAFAYSGSASSTRRLVLSSIIQAQLNVVHQGRSLSMVAATSTSIFPAHNRDTTGNTVRLKRTWYRSGRQPSCWQSESELARRHVCSRPSTSRTTWSSQFQSQTTQTQTLQLLKLGMYSYTGPASMRHHGSFLMSCTSCSSSGVAVARVQSRQISTVGKVGLGVGVVAIVTNIGFLASAIPAVAGIGAREYFYQVSMTDACSSAWCYGTYSTYVHER
jgi:hypothetical protein